MGVLTYAKRHTQITDMDTANMKITSTPQLISIEAVDKVLQVEISKHEKYKQLYKLLQIEQSNKIKIESLMFELNLCTRPGYDYIPMSPSERIKADTAKRTKNKQGDDANGSEDKPITRKQPKQTQRPPNSNTQNLTDSFDV
jgi:predicted transcriptional regulator